MNDGIPVPFFGRPAMTAPALAVLALRFDCDVLPLRVERPRWRTLPGHGLPAAALGAQRRASCRRRSADGPGQRDLEAWIRDRPEQWLWVHRRWPD